jgi:glutathione S-transferase
MGGNRHRSSSKRTVIVKLYSMAGTCALAPHIAAREAGLDLEIVEVRRAEGGHVFGDGTDYRTINPMGAVPALEIEGGVITETQAILRYLAAQAPERLPFPAEGMPHWRMVETLNFITTEIHCTFSPMWNPNIAEAHKADVLAKVGRAFSRLEVMLGDRPYLGGDRFSVADAYAFVTTGWGEFFGMDFQAWPVLLAYRERIAARPSTQQALREQG